MRLFRRHLGKALDMHRSHPQPAAVSEPDSPIRCRGSTRHATPSSLAYSQETPESGLAEEALPPSPRHEQDSTLSNPPLTTPHTSSECSRSFRTIGSSVDEVPLLAQEDPGPEIMFPLTTTPRTSPGPRQSSVFEANSTDEAVLPLLPRERGPTIAFPPGAAVPLRGLPRKVPQGHNDAVTSIEFSPHDASQIASCSSDGRVLVWNLHTGDVLREMRGHSRRVWSLSFSCLDPALLGSASDDGRVLVWDLNTGAVFRELLGHTDRVFTVALSPHDRAMVASGGRDRRAIVWNLDTGGCLELIGHKDRVWSISFSPHCKSLLASGSDDRRVLIWDLTCGVVLWELHGHKDRICCVSFSILMSLWLASASKDGGVRVWDLGDGSVLDFREHTDCVYSVQFSPHSRRLMASASMDGRALVWDLGKKSVLRELRASSASCVYSVAFSSHDYMCLAGAFDNGSLAVWDLESGSRSMEFGGAFTTRSRSARTGTTECSCKAAAQKPTVRSRPPAGGLFKSLITDGHQTQHASRNVLLPHSGNVTGRSTGVSSDDLTLSWGFAAPAFSGSCLQSAREGEDAANAAMQLPCPEVPDKSAESDELTHAGGDGDHSGVSVPATSAAKQGSGICFCFRT